jgi:hypothetical protein
MPDTTPLSPLRSTVSGRDIDAFRLSGLALVCTHGEPFFGGMTGVAGWPNAIDRSASAGSQGREEPNGLSFVIRDTRSSGSFRLDHPDADRVPTLRHTGVGCAWDIATSVVPHLQPIPRNLRRAPLGPDLPALRPCHQPDRRYLVVVDYGAYLGLGVRGSSTQGGPIRGPKRTLTYHARGIVVWLLRGDCSRTAHLAAPPRCARRSRWTRSASAPECWFNPHVRDHKQRRREQADGRGVN